jgi:PAS domain-containing protein
VETGCSAASALPGSRAAPARAGSAASVSCSSCSTTTTPPNAAFFICDQQARLIGAGRGARELTGLGDLDVIGRPVQEVLGLEFENGDDHIGTALEWGVRVLDKPVVVHAEGDRPEAAKADIFPAYDDDGGLLLVLTPKL